MARVVRQTCLARPQATAWACLPVLMVLVPAAGCLGSRGDSRSPGQSVDEDVGVDVDRDSDGDGVRDVDEDCPDDPARFPGNTELCNGVDDDCDQQTDEAQPFNPGAPLPEQWVLVCPGSAVMGSPGRECAGDCRCGETAGRCVDERCPAQGCLGVDPWGAPDEGPQHKVTVSEPLLVKRTEVTQAQWTAMRWRGLEALNPSAFRLGGLRGCRSEPCPERPVESLTWYEALAWCNWRSEQDGLEPCYRLQECAERPGWGLTCAVAAAEHAPPQRCPGYRLPTEAEWERAARAGTATDTSAGALLDDDCAPGTPALSEVAWAVCNAGARTHVVGTLDPNPWGLHDLHGNVAEWCWDWYGEYPREPIDDPAGPSAGSRRVARGGGWASESASLRSASRAKYAPDKGSPHVGFRPVRTVARGGL